MTGCQAISEQVSENPWRSGIALFNSPRIPLRREVDLCEQSRPKLVVLASDVCHAGDTRAVATLRSIDATLSTIELEGNFSGNDAGEAAERLLHRIRTTLGDRGAPSTAQA